MIYRVQNPMALALPSLQAFLRVAFTTNTLVEDIDAALAELAEAVLDPDVALFVAGDGLEWTTMAMCAYVRSALNPCCQVVHFYNRAGARERDEMVQQCVEFTREGGFSRLIGTDMHRKPRAFQRVFRAAGPSHPVGQTFIFDVAGTDEQHLQGQQAESEGHDSDGVHGPSLADLL